MFYFHMYSKWIHLPCPFKETSESLSFELTVNSATRGQHTIMTTQLETVIGWLCVAIDTRLHEADLSVMRLKDTEGSVELEDGRRIPITSWKEFYTHTHTQEAHIDVDVSQNESHFCLSCFFYIQPRAGLFLESWWTGSSDDLRTAAVWYYRLQLLMFEAATDVWGSYSHMLELFLIIFFVV